MDKYLDQKSIDLYDYLIKNFDEVFDKNIIISRNIAIDFNHRYERMFVSQKPLIEQKGKGILFTYDMTEVLGDDYKIEGELKIFDDQSHSGFYQVTSFSRDDKKYKANINKSDTLYIYENKLEKKEIFNREKI